MYSLLGAGLKQVEVLNQFIHHSQRRGGEIVLDTEARPGWQRGSLSLSLHAVNYRDYV